MSRYNPKTIYDMLPAVYRTRDAERGFPLRDLIEVLASQAEIVERDIDQLYENQFIETCEPWAVPYIGDLIGARFLPPPGINGRAEIADTIGLRRRKGTASALEQLARNVTGWPARVVEYFDLLPATQHTNHIRLHRPRTPDLRNANALEHVGRPLDTAGHLVDVRHVASRRGKHNIPNVGLHLYRLLPLPLHLTEPTPAGPPGCYRFSALGHDAPLFQNPVSETSVSHLAEEANLPVPVRRRALHADLSEQRGQSYGAGRSIALFVRDAVTNEWRELQGFTVLAADLTDFNRTVPPNSVAIDPVLGRLKFTGPDPEPAIFRVSCHTGFPAAMGSGQYDRAGSIAGAPTAFVGDGGDALVKMVTLANPSIPRFDTLNEALIDAQSAWENGEARIIEILDSRTYPEDPLSVQIPEDGKLTVRAANGQRPAILLPSAWDVAGESGSAVTAAGILLAGGGLTLRGSVNQLNISHCTFVPGGSLNAAGEPLNPGAVSLDLRSGDLEAEISHSILGAIVSDPESTIAIVDSIVDANAETREAFGGPDGLFGGVLTVVRSTIVGAVRTSELTLGEDSIFLGQTVAERRQLGCVRFCWLNPGSRVPRRFHCLPEIPGGTNPAEAARIARRAKPRFTTLTYGRPAYAQLDWRGPAGISRGASDESEMGAYAALKQPQKEDALQARLSEFLPVQLEAGIFWAS